MQSICQHDTFNPLMSGMKYFCNPVVFHMCSEVATYGSYVVIFITPGSCNCIWRNQSWQFSSVFCRSCITASGTTWRWDMLYLKLQSHIVRACPSPLQGLKDDCKTSTAVKAYRSQITKITLPTQLNHLNVK